MHEHVKRFLTPGEIYLVTIMVPAQGMFVPVNGGTVTAENVLEQFEGYAEYSPLQDGRPDLCDEGCCLNFNGIGHLVGALVKIKRAASFREQRDRAVEEVKSSILSAAFGRA